MSYTRRLLYNAIDWQTLFTWLWRWLPLRLSKRQSPSTAVLFRTTLTRTITLDELLILLGSNHLRRISHSWRWFSFVADFSLFPYFQSTAKKISTSRKVTAILVWWRQRSIPSGLLPANSSSSSRTASVSVTVAWPMKQSPTLLRTLVPGLWSSGTSRKYEFAVHLYFNCCSKNLPDIPAVLTD